MLGRRRHGPGRGQPQSVKLRTNISQRNPEELFTVIYFVNLVEDEVTVQLSFERRRILGEDQCVHIEIEWHARVSEFTDTIKWFKAPGQANFEDVLSERTDVRNDIHVSAL